MILEPYQLRAINALVVSGRGVCVAPARSGKTVIGAEAIIGVLQNNHEEIDCLKFLWICNTTEQMHQAAKALQCLAPARHKVRGWVRHFSNVDDLPLDEIDLLIVDECHHAPADFWKKAIQHCRNVRWSFGLTATPHREDGLWPEVEKIIGPIVVRITPEEVANAGRRVVPRVTFHGVASDDCMKDVVEQKALGVWEDRRMKAVFRARKMGLDIDMEVEKEWGRVVFTKAMKYALTEFEPRLGVTVSVIQQALKMQRHVLCLVYSVEQGRAIMEQVPEARLVFSQMRVKADGRRSEIVDAFRSGHVKCLIATSLADEGLDVPKADCLVLAGGGRGVSKEDCIITGGKRATSKIEQRTARVLTAMDGKNGAEVHDFLDRQHPMLRAASWSRMKAYKMLGYDVGPMPRYASRATRISET